MERPAILMSELRPALVINWQEQCIRMRENVTEMISDLDDFKIDRIAGIIKEINDIGNIPKELGRSIFKALPNKRNANECELHWKINLLSHLTVGTA